MEYLSKVADAFQIHGRGLVLVPEKPENDFLIKVGTELELRTPNGRSLKTHITGVESLRESLDKPRRMTILVTRDIGKADVPIGTEIWYVRQEVVPKASPLPPK
jgi:translation elongation factor EF-Tu-like GTPase